VVSKVVRAAGRREVVPKAVVLRAAEFQVLLALAVVAMVVERGVARRAQAVALAELVAAKVRGLVAVVHGAAEAKAVGVRLAAGRGAAWLEGARAVAHMEEVGTVVGPLAAARVVGSTAEAAWRAAVWAEAEAATLGKAMLVVLTARGCVGVEMMAGSQAVVPSPMAEAVAAMAAAGRWVAVVVVAATVMAPTVAAAAVAKMAREAAKEGEEVGVVRGKVAAEGQAQAREA
jgi:hypothetical protein